MTNYSLLELADFNQPLLKRLVIEAPGTYHHSLIVSNLAEGATDTIGANALLTRVGAYYHDIGKLVKAEYFTENQMLGDNKHDDIEPTMSRLVILNHVIEGIELGKNIDSIPPSLILSPASRDGIDILFLSESAGRPKKEAVNERISVIRVPSRKRVKPQSRLADSVEGAARGSMSTTRPILRTRSKRLLTTNLSTASWMNATSP